jgi:hypothetical protein
VVIAPGLEVFPVGGIRVQRVLDVTMGDIGTRPSQEILDRCNVRS